MTETTDRDTFRDPFALPWRQLTAGERINRLVSCISAGILLLVVIPVLVVHDIWRRIKGS
jgi:hypothetical protein